MFRSHRRSCGRTPIVTLGLAAALLSTSVEAAGAPDPFVPMLSETRGVGRDPSGAERAAAPQLLRRMPQAVRPDPSSMVGERCAAQAMSRQLIAVRPGCDAAAEDLAARIRSPSAQPQGHTGAQGRAALRGGRGQAETDTTE